MLKLESKFFTQGSLTTWPDLWQWLTPSTDLMLQWAVDNVEIHLTHIIRAQLHYAKAAEDIKLCGHSL